MVFRRTELDGLVEITRTPREDARGRFARIFDSQDLLTVGWHWSVGHVNFSETSRAGTVRGLHYQVPPSTEAKLVTCVRGEIWDVAVDVRTGSPTFLGWCARTLSGDRLNSMLVPPGFAHGFQAMSDHVSVMYLHSAAYAPQDERGLHAEDERLGVTWPLPVCRLSERDSSFPPLDPGFTGVTP
ncbi:MULTISPECIES: dTDP-4-dehydrorhamnose 3,5-epimerase family protein [unclassified Streptomyces]|uniref:dTDP-4-dehydrorhamnose 3,5-epimerase family protein n=1 Tax=unclassified Streptomyces TaxID=2593676 RepID=UPI002E2F8AE3|nr:dTDP-4-dehydrorhamnose 3,5-epimerase family protein [Streptomyces sp. NBC_01455]